MELAPEAKVIWMRPYSLNGWTDVPVTVVHLTGSGRVSIRLPSGIVKSVPRSQIR